MFRSIQQVDKHVDNYLSKYKDPKQRQQQGFEVAKLYFDVKDYQKARSYLDSFLAVRSNYPPAWKLKGEVCMQIGDILSAYDALKMAYQLDVTNKELLVHICELCSKSDEIGVDNAKLWLELAEPIFPRHKAVQSLKERINRSSNNQRPDEIAQLLESAACSNPQDPEANVKLVRFLMKHKQLDKAFHHCRHVISHGGLMKSLLWLRCALDVFESLGAGSPYFVDRVFVEHHLLLLLAALNAGAKVQTIREFSCLLARLDSVVSLSGELVEELGLELDAQLFFYAGVLLQRRLVDGSLPATGGLRAVYQCYLLSHAAPALTPIGDDNVLFTQFLRESCLRRLQAGPLARSLCQLVPEDVNAPFDWLGVVRAAVYPDHREDDDNDGDNTSVMPLLLTGRREPRYQLDDVVVERLMQEDFLSSSLELLQPSGAGNNLNFIAWLLLREQAAAPTGFAITVQVNTLVAVRDVIGHLFPNLPLSNPLTDPTPMPETLCQLDLFCFLVATLLHLQARYVESRPASLPLAQVLPLSLMTEADQPSPDQTQWWNIVHDLCTNSSGVSISRHRLLLVRGLEQLRLAPSTAGLCSPHRMAAGTCPLPPSLVLHLAHAFTELARYLCPSEAEGEGMETEILETWAEFYWDFALQTSAASDWFAGRRSLSQQHQYRLTNGCGARSPSAGPSSRPISTTPTLRSGGSWYLGCLFPLDVCPDTDTAGAWCSEGAIFKAKRLASCGGDVSAAIHLLDRVETGQAAFEQAKLLLDTAAVGDGERDLLARARDYLHKALDRSSGAGPTDLIEAINEKLLSVEEQNEAWVDELHGALARHPGDRGDSIGAVRDSPEASICPALSDSLGTTGTPLGLGRNRLQRTADQLVSVPPNTPASLLSSPATGRRGVTRPTPERLDAQIRMLTNSQEKVISQLIEHNSALLDQHRQLSALINEANRKMAETSNELAKSRETTVRLQEVVDRRESTLERATARLEVALEKLACSDISMQRSKQDLLDAESKVMQSCRLSQLKSDETSHSLLTVTKSLDDLKKQVSDLSVSVEQLRKVPAPAPLYSTLPGLYPLSYIGQLAGQQQTQQAAAANILHLNAARLDQTSGAECTGGEEYYFYDEDEMASLEAGHGQWESGLFPHDKNRSMPSTGYFQSSVEKAVVAAGADAAGGGSSNTLHPGFSRPVVHPATGSKSAGGSPLRESTDQQKGKGQSSGASLARDVADQQKGKGQSAGGPAPLLPTANRDAVAIPTSTASTGLGVSGANARPTAGTTPVASTSGTVDNRNVSPFVPVTPTLTDKPRAAAVTTPAFGNLVSGLTTSPVTKPVATTSEVSPFQFSFGAKSTRSALSELSSFLQQQSGSSTSELEIDRKKETSGNPVSRSVEVPQVHRRSSEQADEPESDIHPENYEPVVEFQPIIELPALVPLTTGEEKEVNLFAARCQLFRFDKQAKQWKTRGVGEVKILANIGSVSYRIVMRRDQVKKLCANHYITSWMTLKDYSGAENAVMWSAMDFSEEELKEETFAAKFKQDSFVKEFRRVFIECVAKLSESEKKKEGEVQRGNEGVDQKSKSVEESRKSSDAEVSANLKSFQPKPGSWECSSCLVQNSGDKDRCVACQSGRDRPPQPAQPSNRLTKASDDAALKAKFSAPAGSWDCPTCLVRNNGNLPVCAACSTVKPGSTGSSSTLGSLLTGGGDMKLGNSKVTFGGSQVPSTTCAAFTFGVSKVDQAAESVSKSSEPPFRFGAHPSGSVPFPSKGLFGVSGQNVTSESTVVGASASEAGKVQAPQASVFGNMGGSQSTPVPLFGNIGGNQPTQRSLFGSTGGNQSTSLFNFGGNQSTQAFQFGSKEANQSTQGSLFSDVGKSQASHFAEPGKSLPNQHSGNSLTDQGPQFGFQAAGKNPHSGGLFGTSWSPSSDKHSGTASTAGNRDVSDKTKPLLQPASLPVNESQQGRAVVPSSPGSDNELYQGDDGEHLFFQPVLSKLPEKVEVRTGEEDEETVFCGRAKLFRWSGSEWKERGVGELKLLRSEQERSSGSKVSVRVVMRRDQVLKVCCNHYLTGDMRLKAMQGGNGKAWTWLALDFAESLSEGKKEVFSARFKTVAEAEAFKKAFEECLPVDEQTKKSSGDEHLSEKSSEDEVEMVKIGPDVTEDQIRRARVLQLPDNFYYFENLPDGVGVRDDSDEDEEAQLSRIVSSGRGGSAFEVDAAGTSGCGKLGEFMFNTSGMLDFGSISSSSGASGWLKGKEEQKPVSSSFKWSGAGNQLFLGARRSKVSERESEGDDVDVDEGADPEFEPVIPLPVLVKRSTGEESESVEFRRRCRLYRFGDGQWKERGIGEMKVLVTSRSGEGAGSGMTGGRLVMRREQVLKLCCNQRISVSGPVFTEMASSVTGVCWVGLDCSEGEPVDEKFAVKFKTPEELAEFKTAVSRVQDQLRANETGTLSSVGSSAPQDVMTKSSAPEVATPCTDNNGANTTPGAVDDANDAGNSGGPKEKATGGRREDAQEESQHSSSRRGVQEDQQKQPKECGSDVHKTPKGARRKKGSKKRGSASGARQKEVEDASNVVSSGHEDGKESEGVSGYSGVDEEKGSAVREDERTAATTAADDDEEDQILFTAQVQLRHRPLYSGDWEQCEGQLRVVIDEDVAGARLRMTPDAAGGRPRLGVVCNHIITVETELRDQTSAGRSSVGWSAMDFSSNNPVRREFVVEFSSSDEMQEFVRVFDDAKAMAIESQLYEHGREESREITCPETVTQQDTDDQPAEQ